MVLAFNKWRIHWIIKCNKGLYLWARSRHCKFVSWMRNWVRKPVCVEGGAGVQETANWVVRVLERYYFSEFICLLLGGSPLLPPTPPALLHPWQTWQVIKPCNKIILVQFYVHLVNTEIKKINLLVYFVFLVDKFSNLRPVRPAKGLHSHIQSLE